MSLAIDTSLTPKNSSFSLNGSLNSSSLKRKRPPMIEIPNVLTEIQVDSAKKRVSSCCGDDGFVCSSGFGVGIFAVKGKKKTMEDAHTIVSCPIAKKGFFGVYDGHGGNKAAQFVAENLHGNIKEMLEKFSENGDKEEAVKQGYLKTDQDFLKQGVSSGACCVTALIKGDELIVSNVGDCRAVLCQAGTAEAITKDHRASEEDERKRIEDKGGYVEMHRGAWRVHGVLSVSRSVGDAHLKDWVLAEPDTKILHLTSDMEYLVLASDGLWEQVGNQEAIDILLRTCAVERKLGASIDAVNVNDDEYNCISTSASPKLHRQSLIKKNTRLGNSPIYRKRISCCKKKDEFGCENESPASKARRISLVSHMMKPQMPSQEHTINQRKEIAKEFGCENESPPSKAQRISFANQIKRRPQMSSQDISINHWKENANDIGSDIEFSPSSKALKPLLANQTNMKLRGQSQENSIYQRKENINDFAGEDENPPSKAQEISPAIQMKIQHKAPSQQHSIDKKELTSGGLVAACKELANLALSRGSLDDITVMIIDLHHLRLM
ncbi:Protein-serine/threonine phosphatase [Heracleum sosnowskyi]|uniref:protein-serine/threonine phosphatase n=1 Tax=Heracleum sosnowskyi TaxID=360622 RepID=A0AAD8JFG7_9APIA|nr:Protein-serine/threonine phosphatase [Heracleum sosnowskyi]